MGKTYKKVGGRVLKLYYIGNGGGRGIRIK